MSLLLAFQAPFVAMDEQFDVMRLRVSKDFVVYVSLAVELESPLREEDAQPSLSPQQQAAVAYWLQLAMLAWDQDAAQSPALEEEQFLLAFGPVLVRPTPAMPTQLQLWTNGDIETTTTPPVVTAGRKIISETLSTYVTLLN